MRVRVEIVKKDLTEPSYNAQEELVYEAQSILFTRTQERFITVLREVPALIVLLDSGEYKVQPLVIHDGVVKVFAVSKPKVKWWKRLLLR